MGSTHLPFILPSRYKQNALKHVGKKKLTLNGGSEEGLTVKVMSGAGWLRIGFFSLPSTAPRPPRDPSVHYTLFTPPPAPPHTLRCLTGHNVCIFRVCWHLSFEMVPLACPTGPSQFPLLPLPPDLWFSGMHLRALPTLFPVCAVLRTFSSTV